MSVFERVQAVVVNEYGVEPEDVVPEASLIVDLGGDSLDYVELVMGLEEEFDVRISDEEAEACSRVADLVELMERKAGS